LRRIAEAWIEHKVKAFIQGTSPLPADADMPVRFRSRNLIRPRKLMVFSDPAEIAAAPDATSLGPSPNQQTHRCRA